jgi:hypothetical protein
VQALTQGLEGFNRLSLQQGAAALMLWPGNADRHAALQELVAALATAPDGVAGRDIEASDWAEWLAGADANALQGIHPDGIHDAPLAFQATLLGRRRALLGARLGHPAVHYQLWMKSLRGITDPDLEAASLLLLAASSICDLVVEKGGLGASKWPHHDGPGAPVVAPPEDEYVRLRNALHVTADADAIRLLDPLRCSGGAWQPLVATSDSSLLIVDPWQFSLAALVHAVARAATSARFPEVLERLRRAMLTVATGAAREMGWTVCCIEEGRLVARADRDCLVVIGADVVGIDPGQFAAEAVSCGDVEAHWQELADHARSIGASHSLLALVGDGRAIAIEANHPCLRPDLKPDSWLVGIGELQVIGEAHRQDALALPTALRSIPRPPWPENCTLLDVLGVAVQMEEQGLAGEPSSDGAEHMLQRARIKAMRHPAILHDLSGWAEVSRWEGAGSAPLFRFWESEEFALLARASGRFVWVSCASGFDRRFDLLPCIVTALTFWVDRLCKAGLLLGSSQQGKVVVHFRLELDRRPGPQLAFCSVEAGIRMILGPGFVDSFCRGDNGADRTLAAAVIAWAEEVGDPPPEGLLDEVLPPGRRTFAIWPDPKVDANPPLLEFPPPVEPRARQEVELGLAARRVKPAEVLVASNELLGPVLEELSRTLEAGIQEKLDSLHPDSLRELVAMHERASFQGESEAILLPALGVWRAAEGVPLVDESDAQRGLVLRVLIERAVATHPAGELPLGLRILNWLRAATELQLQLRSSLDAVQYEEAGGQVVVAQMLGVRISLDGELPEASTTMFEEVLAAAPDRMAARHHAWWVGEPGVDPDPVLDVPVELAGHWKELDSAMGEEWGVRFEQMVRLLRVLSDIAGEGLDCVGSATALDLERDLSRRVAVPTEVAAAAIDRLTLGPCAEFDTFDEAHQPGRANRDRSYLRRPLVLLPDGKLAWSSLHCLQTGLNLEDLIRSGRLRGDGRLRKSVIWISQQFDEEFEDEVLTEVVRLGWHGKVRVTRLGGKRLERAPRQTIGDLDVLAWDEGRREVWLLDAKRLFPGIQPGPMLREGGVFEEHVAHHEERLLWVRDHLAELSREIEVDDVGDWKVGAALVLDRPMVGARLRELAIPIWTHWGLREQLGPAGAAG